MKKIIATSFSITALLWSISAEAETYRLIDMGLLPGYSTSVAYDINESGSVALTFAGHAGWEAAVYRPNTPLSGLGHPTEWAYSTASAINNRGQLTGEVVLASSNQLSIATTQNGLQFLGQGVGRGINDAGQVTGFSPYGNWGSAATIWSGGTKKLLGLLGTGNRSSGMDINQAGHVVGFSEINPVGDEHAFLYDGAAMKDLGTLPGGKESIARAINDLDEVTGASSISESFFLYHAVVWQGQKIKDLGLLQGGTFSVGNDINNVGMVVGEAENAVGKSVAMLYRNDVMIDLNTMLDAETASSWKLLRANAVNDQGWIVGEATFKGQTRAFLLTTAVPEPGIFSMAGLGLMAALAMLRVRCKAASFGQLNN